MLNRRSLIQGLAGACAASSGAARICIAADRQPAELVAIGRPRANEDALAYIRRVQGRHDPALLAKILGAANEFKEGDQILGVAARDAASRKHARTLLARTRLGGIDANPVHTDQLLRFAGSSVDRPAQKRLANTSLGELKRALLDGDDKSIRAIMPGLTSDAIGCLVKLLSNEELIQLSQKVFNPLPGSQIGAKGYLGARIQPNSPTDNVDDIRWQVFDGWAFAVGDVLLGTNPVSSDPKSVAAIERTLQEILTTFEVDHLLPHCVLSHIDVQAEVERQAPGSTELWFQSIAGTDGANETFDISIEKMKRYASSRRGRFGLYFETGQGADFTNGHGNGFDMVLHESRKYGFARSLAKQVASARSAAGEAAAPWVHLNDVAGFIGPEVFRTREQLVRCCLEDIVMGKLHGLCIGLDVCSTLHMDISLDDLDWCLDRIMPANPAYLMALPTKIDPMLGYLTTGYQDHVRLREKFGYRVNDSMWRFFQQLGVIDAAGRPTKHFGDPQWIYIQYRRRQGDSRAESVLREEADKQIHEVRSRGLFIAQGYGERPSQLEPALRKDIQRIYDDAKLSIWAELKPEFVRSVPDHVALSTNSADRNDYILHPVSGEQLDMDSNGRLAQLRRTHEGQVDVQIVISDGLNALAIMQDGHLSPFLQELRSRLAGRGRRVANQHVVVSSGRVRAGYRIGETLFAGLKGPRAVLHVIGERPGTGHRTFSTYMTAPLGEVWSRPGVVDHNITKVVSGIATTALAPIAGAREVDRLLDQMFRESRKPS